jgi:hypothetical protein
MLFLNFKQQSILARNLYILCLALWLPMLSSLALNAYLFMNLDIVNFKIMISTNLSFTTITEHEK